MKIVAIQKPGFWGGIHPIMAMGSALLVAALPFSVVLILATYGLCKSLYIDGKTIANLDHSLITPPITETLE